MNWLTNVVVWAVAVFWGAMIGGLAFLLVNLLLSRLKGSVKFVEIILMFYATEILVFLALSEGYVVRILMLADIAFLLAFIFFNDVVNGWRASKVEISHLLGFPDSRRREGKASFN